MPVTTARMIRKPERSRNVGSDAATGIIVMRKFATSVTTTEGTIVTTTERTSVTTTEKKIVVVAETIDETRKTKTEPKIAERTVISVISKEVAKTAERAEIARMPIVLGVLLGEQGL